MAEVIRGLGLPEHWTEDLRPHLRWRRLAPGEGVIREGDPWDSLFAVHWGTLQVVRTEEREEPYTGIFRKTVAYLGPGQWFGEARLLTCVPRNATVVALTEAEVLELPKEGFEASLRREPELIDRLVDLVERRGQEVAEASLPKECRRAQWSRPVRAWVGVD